MATVNNTTGAVSSGATANEASFGAFTVTYNAATNSYTLNDGGSPRTFLPSDKVAGQNDPTFTYYSQTSGSTTNQLGLFTPGSGNTRLALTYTSYAAWTTSTNNGTTSSVNTRFFVYGVQTAASSMPTTGSMTYGNGIVDGAAAIGGQSYRLIGSTGSVTANFATGAITTSLTIVGNPDITSTTPGTVALGTITGTASIAAGTNTYSGTFSGTGSAPSVNGINGTLNGAFFGPSAAETGYSFAGSSTSGNSIVGVFVGKH